MPVDACNGTRYSQRVIKSFRHKGLERFFLKGTKAGIQAAHSAKLARQLQRLDVARRPQDMNVPGWKLHALKGDLEGHWAVWVNGNWRLAFRFEGEDAVLVDYRDYH
jgi:proteic killer suppression protein